MNIEYRDGSEIHRARVSGGITNENSSIALGAVKGSLVLSGAAEKEIVFSVPFSIDMILPFATGVIDENRVCSPEEIDALVRLLDIDRDEMARNRGSEGIYVEDNMVSLKIDSYEKHDIVTLLKGKMHEKNQ